MPTDEEKEAVQKGRDKALKEIMGQGIIMPTLCGEGCVGSAPASLSIGPSMIRSKTARRSNPTCSCCVDIRQGNGYPLRCRLPRREARGKIRTGR